MAVKHRCGFCHKVLRTDGTCANEKCPRYVPEQPEQDTEEPVQEETPVTEPVQEEPAKEE